MILPHFSTLTVCRRLYKMVKHSNNIDEVKKKTPLQHEKSLRTLWSWLFSTCHVFRPLSVSVYNNPIHNESLCFLCIVTRCKSFLWLPVSGGQRPFRAGSGGRRLVRRPYRPRLKLPTQSHMANAYP